MICPHNGQPCWPLCIHPQLIHRRGARRPADHVRPQLFAPLTQTRRRLAPRFVCGVDAAKMARAGPRFAAAPRRWRAIYPQRETVFHALNLTPPDQVKVVILGQDPYHGEGEAHGLAFSVPAGVKIPPSLRNIFAEQQQDRAHHATPRRPERLGAARRAVAEQRADCRKTAPTATANWAGRCSPTR